MLTYRLFSILLTMADRTTIQSVDIILLRENVCNRLNFFDWVDARLSLEGMPADLCLPAIGQESASFTGILAANDPVVLHDAAYALSKGLSAKSYARQVNKNLR